MTPTAHYQMFGCDYLWGEYCAPLEEFYLCRLKRAEKENTAPSGSLR
jgi:hypothetical protein